MDENLYDVIVDFIEEKREEYEDWLEEHSEDA
jgi:heterodisulfide reductase subunit C